MNQGIRGSEIYLDDEDRRRFLRDLARSSDEVGTNVNSFCLMGTHFHAVLWCPIGGLSATMQRLEGRYARWFNRRHGFTGPLFRSRFVSKQIAVDAQLLVTSRYVHRNPLELGIAIDSYPWSSYSDYLGRTDRQWVDTAMVLDLVGGASEYRRFVEESLPADSFAVSDGVRSIAPPLAQRVDVAQVIDAINLEMLEPATRASVRQVALVVLADELRFDSEALADSLGLRSPGSAASLLYRARKRARQDAEFADLVRDVADRLDLATAA